MVDLPQPTLLDYLFALAIFLLTALPYLNSLEGNMVRRAARPQLSAPLLRPCRRRRSRHPTTARRAPRRPLLHAARPCLQCYDVRVLQRSSAACAGGARACALYPHLCSLLPRLTPQAHARTSPSPSRCPQDKVAVGGNPDVVMPNVTLWDIATHDFWGNDILRRRCVARGPAALCYDRGRAWPPLPLSPLPPHHHPRPLCPCGAAPAAGRTTPGAPS